MRLAYVTTRFPFGRAEMFLAAEVHSLSLHVEDLYVIATRPSDKQNKFPAIGAQSLFMPMFGVDVLFAALRELRRHPRAVVHEVSVLMRTRYRSVAKLKNVVMLAKALALADKIRELGIGHIHAQWLTTSASVTYLASRLTGVPWSCTAHNHDIFSDNMIREKARDAAFIRVISRRNQRFLLERIDRDTWSKIHVVHLGVDVPNPRLASEHRGRVELLCAARFDEVKGHRYLLDALQYVKSQGVDVHCSLAGDGRLRSALEEKIAALGIAENVTLRGTVNHGVLLDELQSGRYDIAVVASTEESGVHEGIPVSMMEAMAAAVPCISTLTGSLDELIDESTGILVPQRDPAALGEAILKLARDRNFRLDLGRRARERIIEDFNTIVTSAQLYDLIRTSGA